MPNSPESDDIAYQPAQKGYSYSKEGSNNSSKKTNTFITLGLEILVLFSVFFVFLGVLNYFKIISLNNISPNLLGKLPQNTNSNTPTGSKISPELKSYIIPDANQLTLIGKLYGYNEDMVSIDTNGMITNFKFTKDSNFYIYSKVNTSDADYKITQDTLLNLEQIQNLHKKIGIIFTKDDKQNNIIQVIILYK